LDRHRENFKGETRLKQKSLVLLPYSNRAFKLPLPQDFQLDLKTLGLMDYWYANVTHSKLGCM
jgi:hypothetical protein